MGSQIQIQKIFQNTDFFTSSVYELYDLRGIIAPFQRFIVRQGDLVVSNRSIPDFRERGLMKAYLRQMGEYFVFEGSHIIIPVMDSTILFHNEHGLVIIPYQFERLHFYTFRDSRD